MHERNPYRDNPPDFKALANEFSFLEPFVTINPNGKPYLDFRNKEALKALTKAILLKDFGIHINYGKDTLVPTIPLRLNYILWIEDLFKCTKEKLRGLDIGTGGTAVYALLCAKKNNWEMLGTEINDASIKVAQKNVELNNLGNFVKIQQAGSTFFSELDGTFDFSMCNPPFFSSEVEISSETKPRRKDRPKPSGAKTGVPTELVVEGGELQFIKNMIKESNSNQNKCRIYTTMLGIQKHLKILIHELQKLNNCKTTHTTFRQGKTFRWGLAWTFCEEMDFDFPDYEQQQPKPINLTLDCRCPPEQFNKIIIGIFQQLELLVEKKEESFYVVGFKNTWTHQRRRRRQQQRLSESDNSSTPTLEPESDEPPTKVPKLSVEEVSPTNCPSTSNTNSKPIIEFTFKFIESGEVRKQNILFHFISGIAGKDAIHQICQYIKNQFNSHFC